MDANEPEYEVGYGKPPKQFQFAKGQSGNPKGRPKKRKGKKDILEEILETQISVNGKPMTKMEALVTSMVNDAIKGNASARRIIFGAISDEDLLEEFDPNEDDHRCFLEMMRKTRPQRS